MSASIVFRLLFDVSVRCLIGTLFVCEVFRRSKEQHCEQPATRKAASHALMLRKSHGGHREKLADKKQRQVIQFCIVCVCLLLISSSSIHFKCPLCTSRFTQNLSVFRREVNDSMKNSTYGVNSNDMMSWHSIENQAPPRWPGPAPYSHPPLARMLGDHCCASLHLPLPNP